jgi:hypothetical protein
MRDGNKSVHTNISLLFSFSKVTVTGNSFRGFLCQPVPNTGELLQNPQDPVQKQNKCGQVSVSFQNVTLHKYNISSDFQFSKPMPFHCNWSLDI